MSDQNESQRIIIQMLQELKNDYSKSIKLLEDFLNIEYRKLPIEGQIAFLLRIEEFRLDYEVIKKRTDDSLAFAIKNSVYDNRVN